MPTSNLLYKYSRLQLLILLLASNAQFKYTLALADHDGTDHTNTYISQDPSLSSSLSSSIDIDSSLGSLSSSLPSSAIASSASDSIIDPTSSLSSSYNLPPGAPQVEGEPASSSFLSNSGVVPPDSSSNTAYRPTISLGAGASAIPVLGPVIDQEAFASRQDTSASDTLISSLASSENSSETSSSSVNVNAAPILAPTSNESDSSSPISLDTASKVMSESLLNSPVVQTNEEQDQEDQIEELNKAVAQVNAIENGERPNSFGSDSASSSENESESVGKEGARALAVFGAATIIAAVYFYIKFKRIKDRERVHYGILDDREFELRHLSMSSDEEVGFSMRGTAEVNTPRRSGQPGAGRLGTLTVNNRCVDSSDSEEEDATVYSNRRAIKKKKQFTEYV